MTVLPFARERAASQNPGPHPGPNPGPQRADEKPPAALLAVAHGSRDPRHAAALRRLTDAVARARPDLRVELAFLDLGTPDVPSAVARLAAQGVATIRVVPLLLGRGYHVRHDLPTVLNSTRAMYNATTGAGTGFSTDTGTGRRSGPGPDRPFPMITLGKQLGPDPLLLEALDRRLREAGLWPADPALGLVLASAGSSIASARAGIERAARVWSADGPRVVCAYASGAAPSTAQALAELAARGCRDLAVASYFLAPGTLPDRVRAQGLAAGAVVAEPLTTPDSEPAVELVDLVLRRYAAACGGMSAAAAA